MVKRVPSGWSRLLTPVALILLALLVQGPAIAQESEEIAITPPEAGPINVLVELSATPAAVIYGNVLRQNASRAHGEAQNLAVAAARQQLVKIAAEQQRFDSALATVPVPLEELYRAKKVYNGIAFRVEPTDIEALRRLPGVRAVHVIVPEFPTNSTSVPFIGVPNIWGNTIGLPQGVTGTGIKIGVIDTGIDYQHANFGGTGLLTDYQANDRTVAPDAFFPTAKVVGGTDFAGDAYTGNNSPTPDPDPMDCNGHGSHVSGTAAGLGVTAAGTTYGGPYDGSAPFASLRIGPGVAPGASLYALRVFGCTGSTGLTVAAIEWAMDPNGDDDFSDHLDVINMSLGSNFGGVNNTSTAAAENAAAAGVIVVCSAGNAGDTYFITGSPGVSSRTIATAASVDSGIGGAALTVNSPPAIAGGYAASAANSFAPTPAPAPSGQTANIVVGIDPADAAGPLTTDGCSPLTNAAAVAGNIALIDRGTCGFQIKANNAQAAGAIGVIIANNVVGDPNLIALGATGTVPVTIPTVMISLADRNTIVAGLPANATLGAATAADTIASFSSRGPRRASSPIRLKPDIAAPGLNITSTQTGFCNNTCLRDPTTTNGTFIPGSLSLTISGTSMASPHMAGVMALLRQLHPDWSVEQLKALAMNNALHDVTIGANGSGLKYGPGRIGAGRVDPSASATGKVTATNGDETGLVSVSFESTEVVGSATEVKKVRLVNTGTSAATYDLAINTTVDAPGIAFSLPGGSTVTVPAGDSVELNVQMDATGSLMNHTREATVAPGQAVPTPLTLGTLARHWLTEEAGYLVLSQSGTPKLRVPLYLTSRPASTMSAPATITTGGAGTGSTTIPLTGSDVCTGTLGAGPTCTGTFPTTEVSLVTPFELQVVSPQDTNVALPYTDLQYAGVAFSSASGVLMFGVSTWGDWSSPTDVSFNIYIDTNEDGTWDRILFNTNPGTLAQTLLGNANATAQDSFLTGVFTIATNGIATQQFVNRVSSAGADSALFNNNVMFLAATPASLGLTAGDTTFRWKVVTCPGSSPLCLQVNGFKHDEAAGPFFFNTAAQGLNFGGSNLLFDLNGASIPVTWNTANMTTDGALGALLLHHHNKAGQRAEVVVLDTAQQADLAITKSVSPPVPALGQNATFTITVTNNGPNAATGVQVTDLLPDGLTFVSDDGAYDENTGLWTVGSLAVSASATLHIVATVETSDKECNLAQITAGTPLDPNPANNSSQVCVMAPRAADLGVSMSVSSPTVLVGNNVTYTITVTNTGDDPAYAIDLNEAFPAFPALNPASFTASQGVYNPATGLWNLATLGKGFSATLNITLAAPNMAGALTDQSTVASVTGDPNNANNTASATTTVLSPATITATKSVAGSFLEGGTVTYTIVLTNGSNFDQQDNPGSHELVDALPAQLTLVSATDGASPGTFSNVGNTVNWDGVIPANGSVTITITATINAGTALQTVTNVATANFDADGNGVNEATATSTGNSSFLVGSPAAITVTKTVSAGPYVEGGTVTYTVTITNTSASTQFDNPGHEFVDPLPAGLTLVSATDGASPGTFSNAGNTVNWDGAIPGNSSVTITITATINAGTALQTITNVATANFDADGNGVNESTTTSTGNSSFVVGSPATITATKTVSAGPYVEGGTVTYTVTITNTSASAQLDNPGHEFVDPLPAGLTLVSATDGASPGTFSNVGNTVNWDGSIPANSSVTITITATINTGTHGQTLNNQGTVSFDANGDGTNESQLLTDATPNAGGPSDPTPIVIGGITEVPTLSTVGLAMLALLLMGGALLALRRRRA